MGVKRDREDRNGRSDVRWPLISRGTLGCSGRGRSADRQRTEPSDLDPVLASCALGLLAALVLSGAVHY